jgi:hypothetical protein
MTCLMLNSLVKFLPRLVSSASIQFRRFLVPRNLEIVQDNWHICANLPEDM